MDTNRKEKAKRLGEKGFTFFEIAVTLAVLVIGISGFLSIFSASLRTAREVKHDLTGPEVARSAARYMVAKDIRPTTDNPYDIPEKMSGYYVTVSAGRLDHFDFNTGDEAEAPEEKNVLAGECNLNPSNSDNNEFYMEAIDGPYGPEVVTRDELHNHDGSTFTGKALYGGSQGPHYATYIKVRPKGNGNQNTLTINGEPYTLDNGKVYTFIAPATDPIECQLWNSKPDNGNSMGKWYIGNISGADVTYGENMDGGGDVAGNLVTLQIDVYENEDDRNAQLRATGTFFVRMWYRR